MMNCNLHDIVENTKLGRTYALLGNYESSLIHYQGVLQQVNRLISTINEPERVHIWREVSSSSYVICCLIVVICFY